MRACVFMFLQKKKKTILGDGTENELHPLPKDSTKVKSKKTKRPSVGINFLGSIVSVPITKTMVGRARPLPPLNKTIWSHANYTSLNFVESKLIYSDVVE